MTEVDVYYRPLTDVTDMPITMKFGMEEYTMGAHLRATFGPD